MGEAAQRTKTEIEQTRDRLGRRVDELVDVAKVEAGQVARKVAIAAVALAALVAVGTIAKRRVRH